jgi:flavin reductase (DIM6/NTAB) family NADH-FMN oxidoreductase RutF
MIAAGEGWLPIDVTSIGVVTWYTPSGPAAAVPVAWLAVVSGLPPELRAGCAGRLLGEEDFPTGTDFAVNIPAALQFPALRELLPGLDSGVRSACLDPRGLVPARTVHAPLLPGCTLQIECAHGRLHAADWEPELAGDILLLHRGGVFVDPADHADLCALWPLRAILPS